MAHCVYIIEVFIMFTLLTIILLPMGTLMLLFFAPVILSLVFRAVMFICIFPFVVLGILGNDEVELEE